jgi:cytochrome c oxidase subunit I+III
MDPKRHVYPAIVWILALWTAAHVAVGVLIHLYCAARRAAGRLDARYDIDIDVGRLYWHFAAATCVITTAVIAGFPLAS